MRFAGLVWCLIALAFLGGCGKLVDKNNLRVAVMDGQPITRGDLYNYIRSFPENERPQIQNQGDLLQVLNRIIDERIKADLVATQGGSFPEGITREQAREEFFKSLGDEQEQYRAVWGMEVPADGQATPLMQVYGLTAEGMQGMKQHIEQRTDEIYKRARGEEVLGMLAAVALQKGELQLDQKALELEYKFRQNQLKRPERVTITALRFPATPDGAAAAAGARKRMDAGENFDNLVAEFRAKDPSSVFQGGLQNDQRNQDFNSFWAQAAGASVGIVLGPLFLPQTSQVATTPDGKQQNVTVPPSYLVCRVDAREEERALTLDEAKRIIGPPLVVAEMMKRLRAQHGVEIYEENLSSPGDFQDAAKPLA